MNRPGSRGPLPTPAVHRVMNQVATDDAGCWVFGGFLNNGYGYVQSGSLADGTRRPRPAHRIVYEALRGPIPDGHDLHHECRNRACVNPMHLELLEHAEHARQHGGTGPCPRCDADDWYYRPDNGTRQCRECARRRQRKAAKRKNVIDENAA